MIAKLFLTLLLVDLIAPTCAYLLGYMEVISKILWIIFGVACTATVIVMFVGIWVS
jgi:putative effector of murein hydrolase LrgA (UPF0299 family)